jgi:1-acyl-sn-glycerol-3-phosphate acyltransferase
MLPLIITRLVGWAVAIFYDLGRSGPLLADGPVLVTANHPNALVDPLVIFRTAGRATRPLAKAPLFEQALVGTVLRGLGGLPVYRKQDRPELMHLNDNTFDAAIKVLHEGGAVQIYPEGQSHSEPSLTPIRTGAARIALMAEERRDWKLDLRIQPVGLTYSRKHLFRGRAVAAFGESFGVADLRETYERDPREAVRSLTDRIRRGLEALTLNYDHPEDGELVDVAERLYAREKKRIGWREREPMVQRLPRLRRFTEGIKWLRATSPERLDQLREDVGRYLRLLTIFGARESDVPPRYRPWEVVRYTLWQLAMLLLVLPAAAVGAAVWILPYLVTQRIAALFSQQLDQVATYKMSVGLLLFPLWLTVLSVGTWFVVGLPSALAALLLLPACGLAAVAWRDRQATLREDLRVLRRAIRRREDRDRLAELRAELVAEFDRVTEEWRADTTG